MADALQEPVVDAFVSRTPSKQGGTQKNLLWAPRKDSTMGATIKRANAATVAQMLLFCPQQSKANDIIPGGSEGALRKDTTMGATIKRTNAATAAEMLSFCRDQEQSKANDTILGV